MVEKIRNMEHTLSKHSDGHPDEFRQFLLNKFFISKTTKPIKNRPKPMKTPQKPTNIEFSNRWTASSVNNLYAFFKSFLMKLIKHILLFYMLPFSTRFHVHHVWLPLEFLSDFYFEGSNQFIVSKHYFFSFAFFKFLFQWWKTIKSTHNFNKVEK